MPDFNAVSAGFSPLQAFGVGEQIAGENPLGITIRGLLDRVNAVQQARLQAQTIGASEFQKLHGMAAFYNSPEGQQYMQALAQRSRAMLGGLAGSEVPSAGTPEGGVTEPTGYRPQYGMTGGTIDPMTGEVKMTLGETPASQMNRAIATKMGEERAAQGLSGGAAINALKNVVANFKAVRSSLGGQTGRLPGLLARGQGVLGLNPAVKGFNTALTDASVAIGRISAPNARIGPDFMNAFRETLGNIGATDQELSAEVGSNVRQILGRLAANAGQPMDEQTIQQLTNEILATPEVQIPSSPFQQRAAPRTSGILKSGKRFTVE